MCVVFCDDVVILNLPRNPLEKTTRKYVTHHWQMRSKGVNGKISVIFEDCGDCGDCGEGCTLQRTLGVCIAVVL
jgi:hypothetical protein